MVLVHPIPAAEQISGQNINITCTASGNPLPLIRWTHNNTNKLPFSYQITETMDSDELLPQITSTLIMTDLYVTNVGSYRCNVTTSLVKPLSVFSNSALLTMKCKSASCIREVISIIVFFMLL